MLRVLMSSLRSCKVNVVCARLIFAVSSVALALVTGCGGGSSVTTPPVVLTVSIPSGTVVLPQDGTAANLSVTIVAPTESVTLSVTGLPAGVTQRYKASESNPSGQLTLSASAATPAGSYTPVVTINSSGHTATTTITLVVAVVAKVGNSVDTTLGVNGRLKQFMATSFQVAEWAGDFFGTGVTATNRENTLTALRTQHVRLQGLSQAIPMKGNAGLASDWDFTLLDQTVQPVLEAADHSPEFQVAVAPAWMCDSNGHLQVATHLNDFAAYSANLVRYYNKGGFDWGGKHFQSASAHPITWWGIFNEYNINGVSAQDYVKIYNAAVPAMLAVDPTIKLSALEFSDFGLGSGDAGDPMQHLPTFLAPAGSGGVTAQVDIISTHFYSSCNQSDSDQSLFNSIPQFVSNVQYFYAELGKRADLAGMPVWVTENNVNADYNNNGTSACNPGHAFVTDKRGTSAFFAAWRPYVFAELGKAGNQALYHWAYAADQQYGEVDGNSNTFLSYWVDETLTQLYPTAPTDPALEILKLDATESSSVATLATRNADGQVVVMLVDRAVHAASDNNASGDPRTVIVDLSGLGSFSAASQIVLDASTSAASGPLPVFLPPASRMTVKLNGYGVAFLVLKP